MTITGVNGAAAKSILLIVDDAELCALMVDFFAPDGIHVEPVHDGRRGLARALEGRFDLVILDVMLGVLDGFNYCGSFASVARSQ
jgi:two-component system response regulator CpxR